MYFKDRNETNIDDEFENGNILSKIINFINKYKTIIMVVVLLIIVLINHSFDYFDG